MKVKFNCRFCGIEKERIIPNKPDAKQPIYCSKKCKWEHQKETLKGENNPNFNNQWTEKRKKEHSEKVKETYDNNPELRYHVGKSNRGKKFSPELISKMHGPNRTYNKMAWTDEDKIRIGLQSSKKFTEEYKIKNRQTMEERGYWVPLAEMDEWKLYKLLTNFEFGFGHEYIFEKYNDIIKEIGIFHNKNNKNGVVRDHILEKSQGFKYKIFPELIKHPVNCQIITNINNVKKGFFYRKNDIDKQDIIKLFTNIENYQYSYKDQDLCNELIKRYISGERYNKNEYIFDRG